MRKKITLIFLLLSSFCIAQDEPVYSHYMFNSLSFNPAFAGNYDKLHIQSTYRMQWIGIDGAPRTLQANVDAPVYKKMSVGLDVLQDKIGDFNTSKIYANYAYRIDVNSNSRISLGISPGIEMRQIIKNKNESNDPVYNNINPEQNSFNMRVGLYYSNSDFYIGLSSTSILEVESYFSANKINPSRNYYLTTGYHLRIADNTVLYPSILYKDDFNRSSYFNFTTLVGVKSTIWAGLSYRRGFYAFSNIENPYGNYTSNVMGVLIDFELNDQFRIGYNFDYSFSELGNYENGSHEFSLSYFLKSSKSKRMLNPRYL